jgi:hypothetical protein
MTAKIRFLSNRFEISKFRTFQQRKLKKSQYRSYLVLCEEKRTWHRKNKKFDEIGTKVGEKLELDDPKTSKIIQLFDDFVRTTSGNVNKLECLPLKSFLA